MARRKTKKQKKIADKKIVTPKIALSESGGIVISSKESKKKIKSTTFDDSQVSLLYKDLLKTLLVTLAVFALLLSIFVYMR